MTSMRICFFGDSIVNGAGDPDCLGWPGRICAAANRSGHDVTCYNLGIRGNTSEDVESRWQRESALRLLPEHDGRLVFSFGINDINTDSGIRRISLERSLTVTRKILTEARRTRPVLMVSPPPTTDGSENRDLMLLIEAFDGLCRELDVPFLDTFTPLSAGGLWTSESKDNDRYHPRSAGYAAFAEAVQRWAAWQAWLP